MAFASHAREDYWLVISGGLVDSRRAEKRVKQTRFELDTTLIESTSQIPYVLGLRQIVPNEPSGFFAVCCSLQRDKMITKKARASGRAAWHIDDLAYTNRTARSRSRSGAAQKPVSE